jgi:hypothetical protein
MNHLFLEVVDSDGHVVVSRGGRSVCVRGVVEQDRCSISTNAFVSLTNMIQSRDDGCSDSF